MSYFFDSVAYVIVPSGDLTEEMLNNMRNDFYLTGDISSNSLRKNNDETKVLLKLSTPLSSVFNGYRWYNSIDIKIELGNSEWQGAI